MSKKNFSNNISGKGYYIALVLCAVAIGITGYLYYRNADSAGSRAGADPTISVDVTTPGKTDVEAVATQPGDTDTTKPKEDTGKKPFMAAKPVSGETVSDYSMEALAYNQTTRDWRVHNGMDIAAEAGTAVCAAADGEVYTVYDDETMGMTVVIRHEGGYTTSYASLAEEVAVNPGDKVTAGQTIGYVGATALLESAIGDHVHFSVSCNGELVDPNEFLQ